MKFTAAEILALLSLASTATAAPQKRFLTQLSRYAQWSAAAYCSGNTDGADKVVACSAGNCPDVQASGAKMLYEFDDANSYGDAAGFLAVDSTQNQIVLSFRGSRTTSNWIANLDTTLISSSLCSGCQVHQGFWLNYQTVAATLKSQIDAAKSAYPGYALVITGHSLGGALAMLCGMDLHNQGYAPTIYTYGQPRVGNLAMAEYITSVGNQWRVTHTDDTVPKLPPRLYGFSHASPEYWITSGDNVTVTTNDVTVVTGVNSLGGNDGTLTSSVAAHNWYIVNIDGCS
ncbi:Lipase [Penicillium diatomitis]|uniref:Lipase n=1 Tax=Penicillium diatomitis TaxID=2819901 RepID=A0A9W9XE48_9EURO|nr:Lipase [Penicillium diatomitis]KAJ5489602.1 Lipase [Penicillium diatomitis]